MRQLIAFLMLLVSGEAAHSAGPFAGGAPAEPSVPIGPQGFIAALAHLQAEFLGALTGAVRASADSPQAALTLVGIAFIYGVLHAAGPGHGKAVIGSYMLASRETIRRGIGLAVLSSLLQASVAVLIVGVLAGLFGVAAATMNAAVVTVERGAFLLLTLLGCWLVYRKILRPLMALMPRRRAAIPDASHDQHAHHGHDCGCHHPHHEHEHEHEHEDDGCCHGHMPQANAVSRVKDWRSMGAVILAAGLRPCSGAIVVLVLALSAGIFPVGILAAYAMGAGTALTVGLLAAGASGLVHLADASGGRFARLSLLALKSAEIVGALLVLLLGVSLFAASFQ